MQNNRSDGDKFFILYDRGWKRFLLLWLLVFGLYLPAAKAGFVADFSGWLNEVKNQNFWDNLNRKGFIGQSLYQFTQFNTWIFYQIFGIHEWAWHILFITLHVVNSSLIFTIVRKITEQAFIKNGGRIAFTGVLLYSLSPYLSETLVWEPSFHFLQGLLLILIVIRLAFHYIEHGQKSSAYIAWIVYFLSTFSLEVFYITPWLVAALAVYLHLSRRRENKLFPLLNLFLVPMLVLFVLHLWLFKLTYGGWVAHIGTATVTGIKYTALGKPLKYLFHLLFLGRFFSPVVRDHVYDFCSNPFTIAIYLSAALLLIVFWIGRFKKLNGTLRVAGLLFIWMLLSLVILIPLWFQELQLVIYDRYLYFAAAWFYMLISLLASAIAFTYIRVGILLGFALLNLRFAILVNRYWGKSAGVIYGLFQSIPDSGGKTYLLLNIPQNMNGVAMIGAEKNSEFKLLHDLLNPDNKIKAPVYDCMAYNMQTPADGAHVRVMNDTTLRVTLNQWGGWWWYAGMGGADYQNGEYRIVVNNSGATGLSYDLYLKKPPRNFLILYDVADRWKVVDMNNKDWDQY